MAEHQPQIIEHSSRSVGFTPFNVKWIPASARFVCVGSHPRGTGALQVFELQEGKLEVRAEVEKPSAIKCSTFGASAFEKRHLATGDYAGALNVWDLERLEKAAYSVQAHGSMINAIDGCGGLNVGGGAPEIVTGSRDGCVRVWDPRQREAVTSLEPAGGQNARDCWSVCFGNSFNDSERSVCAGYDNGDVKLLDLRTNKLVWETNVGHGVVGLQFDRKDIEMNKLVVTTLESRFRVYDVRTQHPEEGFAFLEQQAHKSTVWQGNHLPQNRDVFATTGGNGSMSLWRYAYPKQRTAKDEETGHTRGVPGSLELLRTKKVSEQPLVSLDWNADKQGLAVVAALDQTVRALFVTKTAGL